MNLIAITDIFGKTAAFEKLISDISTNFEEIEIVDPYDGNAINFKDESDAYRYFRDKVGLNKYIGLLHEKIKNKNDSKQILLGFSIGASAVWVISKKLQSFSNTKGICFYSSQVRNYLEITPKIEIDFYFSKNEPSYDVDDIYSKISAKPKVRCYKTAFLHGFMNTKSQNFNLEGYNKYIKILNYT